MLLKIVTQGEGILCSYILGFVLAICASFHYLSWMYSLYSTSRNLTSSAKQAQQLILIILEGMI